MNKLLSRNTVWELLHPLLWNTASYLGSDLTLHTSPGVWQPSNLGLYSDADCTIPRDVTVENRFKTTRSNKYRRWVGLLHYGGNQQLAYIWTAILRFIAMSVSLLQMAIWVLRWLTLITADTLRVPHYMSDFCTKQISLLLLLILLFSLLLILPPPSFLFLFFLILSSCSPPIPYLPFLSSPLFPLLQNYA